MNLVLDLLMETLTELLTILVSWDTISTETLDLFFSTCCRSVLSGSSQPTLDLSPPDIGWLLELNQNLKSLN